MNAAAGLIEVRVPDLGNFKDVAVIDVMVKPGDSIAVDTPLVTLESDKAAMDVPSTASGVVEKVHATKGGKLNTGDLVATVRADGAQAGRGSENRLNRVDGDGGGGDVSVRAAGNRKREVRLALEFDRVSRIARTDVHPQLHDNSLPTGLHPAGDLVNSGDPPARNFEEFSSDRFPRDERFDGL